MSSSVHAQIRNVRLTSLTDHDPYKMDTEHKQEGEKIRKEGRLTTIYGYDEELESFITVADSRLVLERAPGEDILSTVN